MLTKTLMNTPLDISKLPLIKKPLFFIEHLGCFALGKYTITCTERVTHSKSYSNAYHRAYGATRTVEKRLVTFSQGRKSSTQVELKTWSNGWRFRAIEQAGLGKAKSDLVYLRKHPLFDLDYLGEYMDIKIYKRSILEEDYDYCAVSPMGVITYAGTIRNCLQDLVDKVIGISSFTKVSNFVVWDKLYKLGFQGVYIREFCKQVGFNYNTITLKEDIFKQVGDNLDLFLPYWPELEKIL